MGGILGGGSSINFMMYTRAQGVDFDAWKTPGWSAKELLPLCKKLETFHQDEEGIDRNKHGYDGPIHISDGGFRCKRGESGWIDTVKKMGYKEIVDLQGLDDNDGFSVSQVWTGAQRLPAQSTGLISNRGGNAMSRKTANDKMPPTVTSTLCFRTASIRTSTC